MKLPGPGPSHHHHADQGPRRRSRWAARSSPTSAHGADPQGSQLSARAVHPARTMYGWTSWHPQQLISTHCPYKGDAAYYSSAGGAENAIWTYEDALSGGGRESPAMSPSIRTRLIPSSLSRKRRLAEHLRRGYAAMADTKDSGKSRSPFSGPDFPFPYDDWIKHPAGLGRSRPRSIGAEVAVIGAGISGLVSAYELMKLGLKPGRLRSLAAGWPSALAAIRRRAGHHRRTGRHALPGLLDRLLSLCRPPGPRVAALPQSADRRLRGSTGDQSRGRDLLRPDARRPAADLPRGRRRLSRGPRGACALFANCSARSATAM